MTTTYTIMRARDDVESIADLGSDEVPSFGAPELVAARIAAVLPECVVRRSERASPFGLDRRETVWVGVLENTASNLALEMSLLVADDGEVYGLVLSPSQVNAEAPRPSAEDIARGCAAVARAVGGVAFDGDGVRVRDTSRHESTPRA